MNIGSTFMRLLVLSLLFQPLSLLAAIPDPVVGEHGMVASRSMIASQVGVDIMKQGGNAIDAAVAVGFALAVTYPSAGNLGGGGFMVVRLEDGKVVTLDFRETAPAAASRDMYLDEHGDVIKGQSTKTRKASGVPGTVDGLLRVLEKHGTLSRQQVLAPAIKLAREGFVLNRDLAGQFKNQLRFMKDYPASMKSFSKNGEPYQAGDLWKQPDLAKTLERISKKGSDGFYKGETAKLLVSEMKRGLGLISKKDLAKYESKWRDPIKGTYRGYDIWGMAPPSSGGVLVVQMLNMLEPHDVRAMGWGSAALIHLMIEAERRAYADRAEHLGDLDFVEVPLAKLTDKEYAQERMGDYSADKASDSEKIGAGSWPLESRETTHYSVVDGKGNAVACTTTLNWGYGNKIVVEGAGFLLNNEMDDFSVKANVPNTYGLLGRVANEIQPGKRMLSSMSPTIVSRDDELVLVTGSPGGSTIITTVLQVVVNTIDHEMDINDAVGLPRFHHQWKPNRIIFEPFAYSPDTRKLLEQRGHVDLMKSRWRLGDANSILVKDGELRGMSDPRNAGGAAGY
ncbi:gamma-glutamyltransferase [Sulfidibacter corallicola]|uniref:Glutathione hydrolase proenzyme n=2 Tax=Sulfidibacter corallicola TaxID=2818388 RepID=A0A8A4TG09_SULCO|nr:gamma-glutamyltransferase [Sulfidibacter corallicola]QTD48866.1 gamma-glutamyltransferase [Sulfidibacter corallicola]